MTLYTERYVASPSEQPHERLGINIAAKPTLSTIWLHTYAQGDMQAIPYNIARAEELRDALTDAINTAKGTTT